MTAESAKTQYENAARQQIYSVTEPLLFQLHEDAQHTINRLNRVTNRERWPNGGYRPTLKACMTDNLRRPHEDGTTDLLVMFTAYRILLPLLYHKILKHKLTFLDYSLEANWRLYIINHLLLLYYYTFGDAKAFTNDRPGDPDIIPSEELDLAIDEMIAAGDRNKHPDQPINFYEFIQLYDDPPNGQWCALTRIVDFYNRDPMNRPVLQKAMHAQICLMHVIHKTSGMPGEVAGAEVLNEDESHGEKVIKEIKHALDGEVAPWAEEFPKEAFIYGRAYFNGRLGFLEKFRRQSPTEPRPINRAISKLPLINRFVSRSRMQR